MTTHPTAYPTYWCMICRLQIPAAQCIEAPAGIKHTDSRRVPSQVHGFLLPPGYQARYPQGLASLDDPQAPEPTQTTPQPPAAARKPARLSIPVPRTPPRPAAAPGRVVVSVRVPPPTAVAS